MYPKMCLLFYQNGWVRVAVSLLLFGISYILGLGIILSIIISFGIGVVLVAYAEKVVNNTCWYNPAKKRRT